ncbi:MAG: hypothetical protein ACRCW9_05815 [Cetobacterium sp.]
MRKIKMMEVVELMKELKLNRIELNGLFLELKDNGMTSTNALIEGFEGLYDLAYNMLCANTIKTKNLTPVSERYFSEEAVCVNKIVAVEVAEIFVIEEEVVTVKDIVESSLSKMFYTDSCSNYNADRLTSMLFVRTSQFNEFI